ncbi:TPA: hypothetical protein MW242_002656, partial [Acinetobacter baumannii]|nr:hypothetical protein [Acinetobacter baumannii]
MVTEELTQKLNEVLSQCEGFGEDTKKRLEDFLIQMLEEYSQKLGISQVDLLTALEKGRSYSVPNYYQASKFPSIDKVTIFETIEDFKNSHADKGFRCPSCEGISSNPQKCNANPTECNWTSYGLLGCAGKGFYFMCKDYLLNTEAKVYEIFMPVNLENSK